MACNFWGEPTTNLTVIQAVARRIVFGVYQDDLEATCLWSGNFLLIQWFRFLLGSSLYKNHEPYERWAMNGTFVQEESGQALQYIAPKKIHVRTSPGTWKFFHWPNCRGFLAEEAKEALRNSSSALFFLEHKLDLEPRCSSLITHHDIT